MPCRSQKDGFVRIERLQVDQGFLDGLDVHFAPGLNVLIGERGTGKTSIIELIRYCLGAGSFTDEAKARGHQQAVSVLGDGIVRVTVHDGVETVVLSRTAAEGEPGASFAPRVTVLAQSEIEAVGAQPSGRLRLIDRFRTDREPDRLAAPAVARLKATTAEIQNLLRELDQLAEDSRSLASVSKELEEATRQQADALSSVEATQEQRQELGRLQEAQTLLAGRESALKAARDQVATFAALIQPLTAGSVQIDAWPESAGTEDLLAPIRTRVQAAIESVVAAATALERVQDDIEGMLGLEAGQRRDIVERARSLRIALDEMQQGVGAITRRVAELRERKGQLDTLLHVQATREARLRELTELRASTYDEVDGYRQARFEARQAIADSLNQALGPTIYVKVERSGAVGAYVQALIGALRGSGVHYNTLAPQLAQDLSPHELVVAAEQLDVEQVTRSSDVTADRAASVLRFLRSSRLPDVVAAPIQDSVSLSLLDGREYKTTDILSIGQRCTVVLPILLTSHGGALLVDQPEDHLDNAFVTQTLVERLRDRRDDDQLIFSSHNPNIPVLGEAEQVIVMGSNGRRGFKLHQGSLDDPKVVEYVTSLMEGGADAFRRRAEFYGRTNAR